MSAFGGKADIAFACRNGC